MYWIISKAEEVCANCKHFFPHYTAVHGHRSPVNCGHCAYPRIKHRKPAQSCEHFAHKDREREVNHEHQVRCTKEKTLCKTEGLVY